MDWINNKSLPAVLIVAVFLVAAALVWFGGSKLSVIADEMAEKTGIGRAFVGALMLGGITSLPEIATTVTASAKGNAGMAVSNLLGSISMQITILAGIDFWKKEKPLTLSSSSISVLMQGVCLMMMLGFAAMFMLGPSVEVFHISGYSILLFLFYLLSLYFVYMSGSWHWVAFSTKNGKLQQTLNQLKEQMEVEQKEERKEKATVSAADFLTRKGVQIAFFTLLILAGGYLVVQSSEEIAQRTGIGNNFAGFIFVAITTSLPEVSTTVGAIKLGKYDMALSNIFGTNLLNVALILVADLFFLEGSVFGALDKFTVIATGLSTVLTGVYMTGILTQSRKKVLGAGVDSVLILVFYFLGVLFLYKQG